MATIIKTQSRTPRDYREKYEFRLTVGNNIICQRYFRINNFNPTCLKSYELADTIRSCAATIEEDLKSKTQIYLEACAPQIFQTVEEMEKFFADSDNAARMRTGLGIVVKNSPVDYVWGKENKPVESAVKFDEGEFSRPLTTDDKVTYKFAFCVEGREVCSTVWEGVYPKYVRNSIDLSNRRGKHEGEDISRLNFEQYLDYKLVENRGDLVYGLIKDICYTCSVADKSYYTTQDTYDSTKYDNFPDYSLWVYPDGKLKPFRRK